MNCLPDSEEDSDDEGVAMAAGARGPTKMVLVVRQDLKMGKGKACAQCAHAAVAAYKKARSSCPEILRRWKRC